ncbi:unnamed protein product [Phytomonas sp. Hart1]|nr:unnamed protein product [Phytomonas sp. Hart1]|eukprot:CCW68949.1 unnamed protein product [Phytomonas sp. isolate Hart1]
MEIRIKGLHAVAQWGWDCKGDTCGICRRLFEAPCPCCNFPGENCPLQTGRCHHTFHLHCIEKCTSAEDNMACPMCRQAWE